MTIRNPKDFWSGIIFLTVGLATVLLIRKLPIGTSMHMGPAYFPTVLGTLLGLIGLAVMIRSLIARGEAIGKLSYKNLFLVLGSIVLFATLLRPAGLAITLMLLVFISAYASPKFTWVKSSILAFGLTAFCVIVFVIALGLPIPILGGFFGG